MGNNMLKKIVEFYSNCDLISCTYFLDKYNNRQKIQKYFYLSGKLKGETPYINGVKHGIERFYYPSGFLLMEKHYENDKVKGKIRYYYESGRLESEKFLFEGKEHGKTSVFFDNGNQAFETEMFNGVLDGIDIQYNRNKDIKFINYYINGKRTGRCLEAHLITENDLILIPFFYFNNNKLNSFPVR